ncbi:MAG: hypothetical protein CMQ19_14530 [Gammaproteobacteria bacterium]|nr:hypothetical protein [Gammaproteobacteria bacterium]
MPKPSTSRTQYVWYMTGLTSFVIPMGIQAVLFPWLVVVQLQESASRLGMAQMATQLPGLFLILFGGLLADRIDQRKILISCHIVAAAPAAGLALAVYYGHLSYPVLIIYALVMGTVGPFMQPARDGMLNRIAGDELQRTVTITMGLTFGAQIFGYAAASFADRIGAVTILALQSAIVLSGAFICLKLMPSRPLAHDSAGKSRITQIKSGLRLVLGSNRMLPALIMIAVTSFFYGGSFFVLNPLIVRDIYGGSAVDISLCYGMFMCGTIVSTILLVTSGGLHLQGKGMLLAVFFGGFCLLLAALKLSFYGYLAALFIWGMCGGVSLSMGRTIMQESAPRDHLARVMSIFSLGNIGAMPLGTFTMGFCAAQIGSLASLIVAVAGVWLVATIVWVKTDLATLEPLSIPMD